MSKSSEKREKKWGQLYLRSNKLARAAQLGIPYPRVPEGTLHRSAETEQPAPLNLLFICSRNQWRSPTAEAIFRKKKGLNARSAGTSSKAKHTVTVKDLEWADVVLVMEEKHQSRLLAEYPRLLAFKPMHVLDIPDEYHFMDPELITQLEDCVEQLLSE